MLPSALRCRAAAQVLCAWWKGWSERLMACDGGKLLGLNEPKLKALGIDETDGEIILACLQRLERTNSRNSQRAGSRKSGTAVGNARPAIMTEPDVAL